MTAPELKTEIVGTVHCTANESTFETPVTSKRRGPKQLREKPLLAERSGTAVTDGTNPVLDRLLGRPDAVCENGTAGHNESNYVPYGFFLTEHGLFAMGESDADAAKPRKIAAPLVVARLTRSSANAQYGLQIKVETLDMRILTLNVPATMLHGDPAELARFLADRGARVVPDKIKLLVSYLDRSRELARNRSWLTAVGTAGWADGDDTVFILPDWVCGAQDMAYQPAQANRLADCCTISGTLDAWRENVALPASDSALALVGLLVSLCAPLLRSAGSDSFGLNFSGLTSRGKTTTLQIAASVWGRGADPSADSRAFVRRWNTTPNALEAIAEEHNDVGLFLDELGQLRNPAELGRAIYAICGGRGAERLKSDSSRRATREWRTAFLSTSEDSVIDLMAQAGQHQKGGQALRLIDIPFPPAGLFPGNPNSGKLVRGLKSACAQYYGTAGRAFIQWLITSFQTHSALNEKIQELRKVFQRDFPVADPEVQRAAERFVLMRIAGEMAIHAGILPCSSETVANAVFSVWQMWRKGLPEINDGRRALASIADFITSHPGQFPLLHGMDRLPTTISGYHDEAHKLYLFTDEGLTEAIGTISKSAALHTLDETGLLFKNDNRRKSKHTVAGQRQSFYAIKAEIFGEEPEECPAVPAADEVMGQPRTQMEHGVVPGVPAVPRIAETELF